MSMSIISARAALVEAYSTETSLSGATAAYDAAMEKALKADAPIFLATGELKAADIVAEVGLSKSAAPYTKAVVLSLPYVNDMKPHELRTIWCAVQNTKGVSIETLLKEVNNFPETAKRSDVYRLCRSAIDSAVREAKRKEQGEKEKEPTHKTLTRAATTCSNIKSMEGADLPASAAALALLKAEVKRLEALIIAAAVVTVDEEVPATV